MEELLKNIQKYFKELYTNKPKLLLTFKAIEGLEGLPKNIQKYLKELYTHKPKSSPKKLWFFYLDPYKQGLTTTILTGIVILVIVTLILLLGSLGLIAIGTIGIVVSIVFYGIALASVIGLLGGLASSQDSGGAGCLVAIGAALALSVISSIWDSANGFIGGIFSFAGYTFETLSTPFFWTINFIQYNWLAVIGVILAPVGIVLGLAGLALISMLFLQGVEKMVLYVYGINFTCPSCAQKTEPAQYYCPSCNQKHTPELIPNLYGILGHECTKCRESLPTMMLLGRNKNLKKDCKSCGHPLNQVVGQDKHIGIIGSRNSGKTCFLVQTTRFLIDRLGATIPEETQEADYQQLLYLIESGQVPPQTQQVQVYRAFQLEYDFGTYPYHIYLYDIAGESYEHFNDTERYPFFKTLHSIVFILDPFSFPHFRNKYAPEYSFEHATQDPIDLLANLMQVLEKYNTAKAIKKIRLNVVLVKTDTGYLKDINLKSKQREEQNELLKAFILQELEAESLVHQLEQNFKHINYFPVSSLGRNPNPDDRTPFKPQNLDISLRDIYKSIRVEI